MTNTDEFLRESRRIDQLIWDAMALVADERVLFCGYSNVAAWLRRAHEIGVEAAVIEADESKIADLTLLGIQVLRGSPTMIPARDNSFDAVVAFHYLHELDPTFHALVVAELARVGKRVIVVEPAPPSDAIGRRIAQLYSKAKYEAGAFEEYQPIDYWRKLLAMVKADVAVQQFTFTRLAPRFAVEETVDLILQAMAIEQMPQDYLDELRELARQPDAQLSPLSRFVLVALAAGVPLRANAGTRFRDEIELPAPSAIAPLAAAAAAAAVAAAGIEPAPPPPSFAAHLEGAEFPPVLPPPNAAAPAATPPAAIAPAAVKPPAPPQPAIAPAAAQPPAPPPAAAPPATPFGPTPAAAPLPFGPPPPAIADPPFGFPDPGAEPAFGLPDPAPFGVPTPNPNPAPFGTPFALPDDPDPFGLNPDPAERPGWNWEPPSEGS